MIVNVTIYLLTSMKLNKLVYFGYISTFCAHGHLK